MRNVGFIVPTSIATDHSTKAYFATVALGGRLVSLLDFEKRERQFTLSPEDIRLINPNTRTCPVFRSKMDAELTKKIYRNVPVLIREGV